MRLAFAFGVIAAVLSVFPAMAFAQDGGEASQADENAVQSADGASDEVLSLEEIVVDGAFWGEAKARPMFGQRVEAPRVESVNDWLERSTGVFGDQGGKGYRNIVVRGFMTRQINFQFDGVPLDTGYDGMTALDTMPVNWMSGGRLSHADSGPTDAVGLGGKVDFWGVMPEKLEAGVEISRSGVVGALSHGMSYGAWRWAATAGGLFSEGFYLSHAFEPKPEEDGGLRDASYKRGGNVLLKAGRSLGSWGDLEVFAGWSQAPRGVPTGVGVTQKRYWDFVSQRVALASARLTFDASVLGGQVQVWVTEQGNTLEAYDDASRTTQNGVDASESVWDDQEYGGRIDLESAGFGPDDGFKALLRADMRYQSHDSDEVMLRSGSRTEKSSSRFWYDIRPALEWNMDERYRVFAAAGVNGAVVLSQKDTGIEQRPALNDLVDGSMSIGADMQFIPELTLGVRVARRLRLPTLKEQFRSILMNAEKLPDLKSEVAWHTGVEIGWTPHEKVAMTVGVFETEIRDLIDFRYLDGIKVAYNIDSARMAGVDAALRLGPWAGVSFELAYQYLYAWDLAGDHALNDRPAHLAKIGVSYEPLECLKISLRGQYESKRRTESWLGASVAWLGNVYLLDAEIEYKMEHFSAYLKGTNLLDYNYLRNYGFPEAGINFQLGAKIIL